MKNAEVILRTLNTAGYEAYYVGGCVRDMLMGVKPHDIDITTNARPEEIMNVFSGFHVIPTGLKHGTVTVMSEGEPFEITTYRVDGEYSDGRRPDKVEFSSSLTDDLSRRDFTMNAIAMDTDGRVTDPFGGEEDIKKRIIRCVGEPSVRFGEDALRIMRCIRFASQLGFETEEKTARAVHEMSGRLELISRERIRTELDKLLLGEHCCRVMLEYKDVITQIIPELKPCIGFEQHSPYHEYNVYEHIIRSVSAAPETSLLIRRAMLFHDIGKPSCFTVDENGVGHFKGHAQVSSELTEKIMQRLRYDNRSIEDTRVLIERHSDKISSRRQIKRLLSKMGESLFLNLLDVKRADNSAKKPFVMNELEAIDSIEQDACDIIRENSCMKLSQLAVNGSDLLAIGLSGRKIGEMLEKMLELVIDEKLPNEKEVLINYAEGGMH